MIRFRRVEALSVMAVSLLLGLATRGYSAPPSNHDQELGVPGVITGLHARGYLDPLNNNCTLCHGDELNGGYGPSCFLCHGAFWDSTRPQYPSSHSHRVSGNRGHTPRQADCTFCHDVFGDLFKTTSFWHAPGHGTPYASGCTLCHGPDLDGDRGIAYSCYWCHDRLWAGEGPPTDHTVTLGGFAKHQPGYLEPIANGCTQCHGANLNDGFAPSCFSCHGPGGKGPPADHTELKGGIVPHKAGYENPYENCSACHGSNLDNGFATSCLSCHGSGGVGAPDDHTEKLGGFAFHRPGYATPVNSGCANCHGPDLRGGLGPSCYTCHRREWADHDFSGEPWLPDGANQCQPCHDAPTRSTIPWNHELSQSVYSVSTSTLASIGQPNGNSAKCLGCHEGRPNGPAINDFDGTTGGSEFVFGGEAFGTNLVQHHPVSFTFDTALATLHGGLNNPSTTPSGLSSQGTIEDDMLQEGRVQCTSCHDPHNYRYGQFLVRPFPDDGGLCFTCHSSPSHDPSQHHIPGRADPWGETRGTTFTCLMCHGDDLKGAGEAPGCSSCHNEFVFPDAPLPGHHMGDRGLPYFDCVMCHADSDTGLLTGSAFAPSCFQCHTDIWNRGGNTFPAGLSIAEAVDVDGVPTVYGTSGELLTLTAVVDTNTEQDPLEYRWSFGDGSPILSASNDPETTHAYVADGEISTYQATVWVTDGMSPPLEHRFSVVIEGGGPPSDTWDITSSKPDSFSITFESESGALLGVKDDGGRVMGLDFGGVIYWLDPWIDTLGGVSWGGDIYFGNIDRVSGEMSGIIFGAGGGFFTFSGTSR